MNKIDKLKALQYDIKEYADYLENNTYNPYEKVQEFASRLRTIINDFDTEVGIPTLPYQKKERLVVDEANSKQIDAQSRSIIWYEELKRTADLCNEFMGFTDGKIEISLRYKTNDAGGDDNGNWFWY